MLTFNFSILIIVVIFLNLLYSGVKNSDKGIYLILCFSLLVIFRSLPELETWDDLPEYREGYILVSKYNFEELSKEGWKIPGLSAEKGWIFLYLIANRLFSSFNIFLFLVALITSFAYAKSIKRYLPPNFYCLAILLIIIGPFFQSIFVLRQHLAIAIFLLSFPFIFQRRIVPYLILMAVGTLIHTTYLLVLPVYFMYGLEKKKLILSLLIYFVCIAIAMASINLLANDFYGVTRFIFNVDDDETTNYKGALLLILVLLFRVYLLKRSFFTNGIDKLLSLILIIGVINAFVGVGIGSFMARLNMYYSELAFLYFPNTLQFEKKRSNRNIYGIIYFIVMSYFFFSRLSRIQLENPGMYKFIWD